MKLFNVQTPSLFVLMILLLEANTCYGQQAGLRGSAVVAENKDLTDSISEKNKDPRELQATNTLMNFVRNQIPGLPSWAVQALSKFVSNIPGLPSGSGFYVAAFTDQTGGSFTVGWQVDPNFSQQQYYLEFIDSQHNATDADAPVQHQDLLFSTSKPQELNGTKSFGGNMLATLGSGTFNLRIVNSGPRGVNKEVLAYTSFKWQQVHIPSCPNGGNQCDHAGNNCYLCHCGTYTESRTEFSNGMPQTVTNTYCGKSPNKYTYYPVGTV